MASTITSRISGSPGAGAVQGGSGYGIIQTTDVAGTDTITCESTPEIDEYVTNQLFLIRPANNNTGAVTINVNALGAKSWVKPNGSAYASGELSTNLDYLIKYNGTHFRTVSPF